MLNEGNDKCYIFNELKIRFIFSFFKFIQNILVKICNQMFVQCTLYYLKNLEKQYLCIHKYTYFYFSVSILNWISSYRLIWICFMFIKKWVIYNKKQKNKKNKNKTESQSQSQSQSPNLHEKSNQITLFHFHLFQA